MSELAKQTIANKKWQDQNKEHSNYLKSRSACRSFIRNRATAEDLIELEVMIMERRQLLEQ